MSVVLSIAFNFFGHSVTLYTRIFINEIFWTHLLILAKEEKQWKSCFLILSDFENGTCELSVFDNDQVGNFFSSNMSFLSFSYIIYLCSVVEEFGY